MKIKIEKIEKTLKFLKENKIIIGFISDKSDHPFGGGYIKKFTQRAITLEIDNYFSGKHSVVLLSKIIGLEIDDIAMNRIRVAEFCISENIELGLRLGGWSKVRACDFMKKHPQSAPIIILKDVGVSDDYNA